MMMANKMKHPFANKLEYTRNMRYLFTKCFKERNVIFL